MKIIAKNCSDVTIRYMDLSLLTSRPIILSVLDVALLVTAFLALSLYYHWLRFSPSHLGAIVTMVIYTCGLAALIVALLGTVSLLL